MLTRLKYSLIRIFYTTFRRSKVIKIEFANKNQFQVRDIITDQKGQNFKYIGKSLFIKINP